MSAKKVYFGLVGVVVILCLILVGGAKIITSKLANKSDNLISLQLEQSKLDNEQEQITQAKADIDKYQPLANIAKSIVPQDKNQAEAVREIVKLAGNNGVAIGQINYPKSDLGQPNAKSSNLSLSQLTQAEGINGVYQLPITITSDENQPVNYRQLINFLGSLENNRRTAQVTNISLQPDAKNPNQLSFSLSINEYIKP